MPQNNTVYVFWLLIQEQNKLWMQKWNNVLVVHYFTINIKNCDILLRGFFVEHPILQLHRGIIFD